MNHLDGKAVERYLDKFSDAMHFTRGKLKGEIRAAFCDSFELEGNNWTPGMFAEFEKRMGYSLYPFLPYVFQRTGAMGEPVREAYGCSFSPEVTRDVIERVRHDFWHVQMQLFKENFIDVYNAWCHRNGLKSRIQAYGHQLHPIETSMYLDIPECESWIHDGIGRVMEPNQYLSGRGYSMVNKFVASGAFLANRNIVSCEEQTNVGNIFQTTLEEVKVTGDRSNLSGVNHSVLHGFNYSPRQKDFFGWIQFGTYFNENNTWWPYVRPWMDYKARVSALLQNSVYQADIAILPPLEDLWSIHGMQRDPYPGVTYPAYANDLWEARPAERQRLRLCQREGHLSVVCLRRPAPLRFTQLQDPVADGGREPRTPDRCAHRRLRGGGRTCDRHREGAPQGARIPRCPPAKDARVKAIIDRVVTTWPDRFVRVDAPQGDMLGWYRTLQAEYGLTPYAKISAPDRFMMMNYYKSGDKDIYFVVNSSIERSMQTRLEFPAEVAAKQAWVWDAETGGRHMLDMRNGTLELCLTPAEAKFIVFEKDRGGQMLPAPAPRSANPIALNGIWDVRATHHVDKSTREFSLTDLVDLHSLPFPWLQSFAGTIEYTRTVDVEDPAAYHTLDAGLTHNGITELFVNGEPAGIRWYGARTFDVAGKLRKGRERPDDPCHHGADQLCQGPVPARHSDGRPLGMGAAAQ